MPMFWSKKSKAEKTYDKAPVSAPKAKNAYDKRKATIAKASGQKASAIKTAKTPSAKAKSVALPTGSFSGTMAGVIIRPRITEKSGLLSQTGVYTFEVVRGADKQSIGKAVKALYKVTPVKVAVLNSPAKKVFLRGRKGTVSGFRKALVTLKQGEKIDFV